MSLLRVVALVSLILVAVACVEIEEETAPGIDWAAFATPPAGHGPWVRWWWPGGGVDDAELRREIGVLAAAGIDGAEIQAFAAALDPEAAPGVLANRNSWGTPAAHGHVLAALDAAADAGLAISLTVGSGWPAGGDHLGPEASLKTLLISEHFRTGPGTTTLALDGPDLAPFYQIAESAEAMGEPLARDLSDDAELVTVLAAKVVDGARDPNPLVLTDQVWLDPASLTVLTDAVHGDSLVWEVPAGEWVVVAFWAAPDGEYVSLDAYPGEAWVADHLDAGLVRGTLDALLGPDLGHPALEGFFTDSFELKAERLWAGDFLAEFESRRGYPPEPWLPAVMLPGADNHIFDGAGIPRSSPFGFGPDDARVRHDWQRTVSDLFIERYVRTCTDWAEARGLRSRIQPYGVGIDVIAAAAAAHVPEAEQLYAGGADFLVEAIASGAHLGGRPVVSAESMVWAGKDHMLTPTKLKAAADKLYTAGVNRILFHGFPYAIGAGYGDQGWHPFSSPWSGSGTYGSNVGESNAYWGFMPEISRYLSRVQWALRQGVPAVDVAVYFPFIGMTAALGRLDDWDEELYQGAFPGEPGDDRDALFDLVDAILGPADPGPAVAWMRAAKPHLDALQAAGLTWDLVNDGALATATVDGDGRVRLGEATYGAVMLIDAPWMAVAAAEALGAAVGEGAQLVVEGPAPARVPGLDTGGLDARVAAAGLGGGGVLPQAPFTTGVLALRSVRRRLDGGGRLVFYRNPSPVAATLDASFEGCDGPVLLDPWAGTFRRMAEETVDEWLAPWGSRILTCGLGAPAAADGWFDLTGQAFLQEAGIETWELAVTGADVAEGAVVMDAGDLPDWRDVEALRFSSTPGVYTGRVSLAAAPAGYAVLRLGAVDGAATVSVNGVDAGAALVPPFEVDVTGMLVAGDNTVAVTVIPPLRNRLVGHGMSGDLEYRQYDKEETLVPVGLKGPVEILYY